MTPPPRSSRVMTRPAPPRPGRRGLASGYGPAPQPPGSAPSPPPCRHPRDSRMAGEARRVLTDRKDQTIGPDPADPSRAAAIRDPDSSRARRRAGRRPGDGRAGGSLHHAGRAGVAADPRSPRSGRPGRRAGPAAPAAPAPGPAGRGDARIGRCRTGRDGARRPAGDGARGRRDHARGRGGVRAPGPGHRRHRAGRPRAGADARRGARGAAGADAVSGGDRDRGVHQPGPGRPRADPAPAAGRGRRGGSGLPAGSLWGRAVPHARAGRGDRPAPLPGAGPPVRPGGGRCRHLRLPRARRGSLPGPGRPGAGPAAALARAAARGHRQLPDRRRARYRVGQLAACAPVPLADRDPARGVAGRGRLRRGGPPPHRAGGGAGRAERLFPGPAVPALPDRRGSGRRRLPGRRHRGAAGRADPRPGRHRPGRGPPRGAGASRPGPAGHRGPGLARPGTGSPGREPTRSPGSPPMRRRSAPASWIMSTPRSATTATPRRSPGCCAGSRTGGPEPTASELCSPAPHPRPRSSPRSPARRCPVTSRACPARK